MAVDFYTLISKANIRSKQGRFLFLFLYFHKLTFRGYAGGGDITSSGVKGLKMNIVLLAIGSWLKAAAYLSIKNGFPLVLRSAYTSHNILYR